MNSKELVKGLREWAPNCIHRDAEMLLAAAKRIESLEWSINYHVKSLDETANCICPAQEGFILPRRNPDCTVAGHREDALKLKGPKKGRAKAA